MKKVWLILLILTAIFLAACTNSNVITGKPTSETGSIHVTGTPTNAGVYVDGFFKGQFGSDGEITISGLSVGNHVVEVKRMSYCTIIYNKDVGAGQTINVEAHLALKGNLNVKSTPSNADFSVDGIAGYKTPRLVPQLCAGNHILYFSKTGYETKRVDKYVNGGTITQLDVKLDVQQPTEEKKQASGYGGNIPDVDITDTTQTNIPTIMGSLDASSTPNANIFVDGIYKGTTPNIINLPIGSKSILISKPGYEDHSTTANIVEGQTTSINVNLQPLLTNIYVLTNPSGVSVSIKRIGENLYTLKGITQITTDSNYGEFTISSDLSSGDYSLKLNKNGYQEKIVNVAVTSGQTTTVNEILTALPSTTPATLKVNARSSQSGANIGGADVYVDYALKGKTPATTGYSFLTINNVGTGEHTVTVKKSSYQDYTMTISVNAGEIKEIISQLTPT